MAQSREPNRPGRNNNGLIVASLPDGVWCTPWVRDMAYAAVALARMGHRDEARAALLAYFNAEPTGKMREQTRGADYQISVVRYFGDYELIKELGRSYNRARQTQITSEMMEVLGGVEALKS